MEPARVTSRGFCFLGVGISSALLARGDNLKFILSLLLFTLPAHADIVIGVAGPMTGPYAAFGQAMQNGAQLAVDDLNAKGGIAGEMLVLQPEDDGCDNRKAEIAAQDLISKNAKMVVGHFCSNAALVAAKLYEKYGITMIAPTASLPALTEQGLTNVIRLASRDDIQGEVAARSIDSKAIVAVLNDGAPANAALAARFTTTLKRPPVVAMTFKPEAIDLDGLINDLKINNITTIYLACSASDAARIALALKVTSIYADLLGPDTLLVDQYWQVAGDAAEGTMVTFAVDPMAANEAKPIIENLNTAIGPSIAAYAAVQLFAATPHETAIYLKSGKTFNTAMGPLSFDEKGDVRESRFVWYRWSNGKYSEEK
jgi:branched-chain amino acid transport system substrate-binding protein